MEIWWPSWGKCRLIHSAQSGNIDASEENKPSIESKVVAVAFLLLLLSAVSAATDADDDNDDPVSGT